LLSEASKFLRHNRQPSNIKAYGKAYFFDLNTGIIGCKLIGNKKEVSQKLKAIDYKQTRINADENLERTWDDIIEDIHKGMAERKRIPVNYDQLILS
jgi:hypothetical protein